MFQAPRSSRRVKSVLLFLDQKQVVGLDKEYMLLVQIRWQPALWRVRLFLTKELAPNTLDLRLDLPDEEEARSCLEVKVWDDYDDEWTLRTAEVDHLAHGEFKSYPLTLLGDMEYEFLSCTDDKSDAIQLTLYDEKGIRLQASLNWS